MKESISDFNNINWTLIEEEGLSYLYPSILKVYSDAKILAGKSLEIKTAWDIYDINAVLAVDKVCSELVTGITAETKMAINTRISAGLAEGRSMYDVGRELRTVVGLNSKQEIAVRNFRNYLIETKPGISILDLDKKVDVYAKRKLKERGEAIARTETARAQTTGFVDGMQSLGVSKVEFSASSHACSEVCQPLNGTIYNISETRNIIPDKTHPNCTCNLLPVIEL